MTLTVPPIYTCAIPGHTHMLKEPVRSQKCKGIHFFNFQCLDSYAHKRLEERSRIPLIGRVCDKLSDIMHPTIAIIGSVCGRLPEVVRHPKESLYRWLSYEANSRILSQIPPLEIDQQIGDVHLKGTIIVNLKAEIAVLCPKCGKGLPEVKRENFAVDNELLLEVKSFKQSKREIENTMRGKDAENLILSKKCVDLEKEKEAAQERISKMEKQLAGSTERLEKIIKHVNYLLKASNSENPFYKEMEEKIKDHQTLMSKLDALNKCREFSSQQMSELRVSATTSYGACLTFEPFFVKRKKGVMEYKGYKDSPLNYIIRTISEKFTNHEGHILAKLKGLSEAKEPSSLKTNEELLSEYEQMLSKTVALYNELRPKIEGNQFSQWKKIMKTFTLFIDNADYKHIANIEKAFEKSLKEMEETLMKNTRETAKQPEQKPTSQSIKEQKRGLCHIL